MNKSILLKGIAKITAILILAQTLSPSIALALTGGPSQPEMESFEPVGTTDMVDLFTGDFNYNIPLIDVGGYPLNIAYHSGIGMDQEASWVGLGWNINVGSITRQMRGLPDDFNGSEEIKKVTKIRNDETWSLFADVGVEILGKEKTKKEAPGDTTQRTITPSFKFGITKNNYRGLGYTVGLNAAINNNTKTPKQNKSELEQGGTSGDNNTSPSSGHSGSHSTPDKPKPSNGVDNSSNTYTLGFGASSSDGFEYDASYSNQSKGGRQLGIGTGISSRGGLKNIVFNWNLGKPLHTRSKSESSTSSSEEKKVRSTELGGGGGSRAIPTGPVPNLSEIQNSFYTSVQNYDFKISFPIFGTSGHTSLSGTFISTSLQDKNVTYHPVGYMYAQNKYSTGDAMQDYSRDKDKPLSKSSKFLSPSSSNYDIFSLSGQGTGGMFRPHRYTMGTYTTPDHHIRAQNIATIGAELGFAGVSNKYGISFTPSMAVERSGHWSTENGNKIDNQRFNTNSSSPLNESFHFQYGGEFLPINTAYFNALGGEKAARLKLTHSKLHVYGDLEQDLITDEKLNLTDPTMTLGYTYTYAGSLNAANNAVSERAPRVASISMITADEASKFGWMPSLKSYVLNSFKENGTDHSNDIARTSQDQVKPHHIGEITQLKEDGSKYIYAIPAYNNVMEEAVFNTKGDVALEKGLVNYDGNENSTNNDVGMDHYYSLTTNPGYAHSYLLTSVLSANYVDADLDGKPSAGDIGDYVVFNYTRVNASYKWRVPVEGNKAHYIEGLRSDPTDNKGAYTYGTKEIWMLHSIQTRTHYASFHISKRNDALGVINANGGKDSTQVNYKLDTIALYALNDKVLNGENATPIKKIVFEYDYSLCPKVPNNINYTKANIDVKQTGKLTLKKLYVLYGNSSKGAMSPYSFEYGYNPEYNMACYDRWGNYKPNNSNLNNKDFPYVDQYANKDSLDKYASAWSLNKINLPSGGQIKIELESDDYAFVQDQKASNMIQIVGTTKDKPTNDFVEKQENNLLFEKYGDQSNYNYLVFKLPPNITTDEELKQKAFNNIDQLFFKFLVNIAGKEEYVSGWAQINKNEIGTIGHDGAYYGYVKLNDVNQGDRIMNTYAKVNPIAKTSWQFATMNMSKFLHPGSQNDNSSSAAFKALMSSWKECLDMFRGQYQALKLRGIASTFTPNKSWIRIESVDLKKIGGGARVKSLSFEDAWSDMDESDKTSSYTQEYNYTLEDSYMQQFGYSSISSGVTTFEPSVGAEENSLKLPYNIRDEETNITLPAYVMYDEGPIGESYYPAPVVGYSKVTVKNKSKVGVNRTGTGKTIHEFYTARDFPVRVDVTGQGLRQFGNDMASAKLNSLLKVAVNEFHSTSQGYAFILNDMHGKPKSTSTYSETTSDAFISPISKVTYTYQTVNGVLDNHVRALNQDGTVTDVEIAKTIDASIDLRENERKELNMGIEVNLETDIPPPGFPVVWGFPNPKFRYGIKRQQAATFTKIIQQFGILKSTTAQDEGSLITTSNLLYDKVTGSVILTETRNGFDDPIYNFNFPAYLAYEGMGPAYKNIHLTQAITLNGASKCTVEKNLFFIGDLLYMGYGSAGLLGRVVDKSNVTATTEDLKIIQATGLNFGAGNYTVKVIESGRKNMLTESVGKLLLTKNPIVGNQLYIDSTAVIDASANTYKDFWPAKYLTKNVTTSETVCDISVDTFITQTFMALTTSIEKWRADSAHSNPLKLDSLSWFTNSALIGKIKSVSGSGFYPTNNYLRFCNPNYMCDEFNSIGAPISKNAWADNDSIILSTLNDTTAFNPTRVSSSLKIWNLSGCKFANVDTFFDFQPTSGIVNYTIGEVKALMLNGDTCVFRFEASSGIYDQSAFVTSNCITTDVCQYEARRLFDPYTKGLRGQWRPYENYAYNKDRHYTYSGDTTFIRKDGAYVRFNPLWKFNANGLYKDASSDWVAASKITNYSLTGKPVESMDALGNYTCEIYGYQDNLVVAAASNAKLNEIGNDNFEDYTSIISQCSNTKHWSFYNGKITPINPFYKLKSSDINNPDSLKTTVSITSSTAHTGTQSMLINKGYAITNSVLLDTTLINKTAFYNNGYEENNVQNYLTPFRPELKKKIVIGGWVKGMYNNINSVNTYDSAYMRVKCYNHDKTITLLDVKIKAKGSIIDGWQRMEGIITIPDSSAFLDISLENIGTARSYFDDIRIHPFVSNIKTFVYNPVLLKVMATLDENNFATYYEYDGEGKLVRIKRETNRGVMTIQESRRGINKTLHP